MPKKTTTPRLPKRSEIPAWEDNTPPPWHKPGRSGARGKTDTGAPTCDECGNAPCRCKG